MTQPNNLVAASPLPQASEKPRSGTRRSAKEHAAFLVQVQSKINEYQAIAASLDAAMYTTRVRRGTLGYTRGVNVPCCVVPLDAARLLKRLAPETSKEEHADHAVRHAIVAGALSALWGELADAAMMRLKGRTFSAGDYRISGIGREEFSDDEKALLRKCAQDSSTHASLSTAHHIAAGKHTPSGIKMMKEQRDRTADLITVRCRTGFPLPTAEELTAATITPLRAAPTDSSGSPGTQEVDQRCTA